MMIYSGVNIGIIRNCNFRCSMCTAVETHDKDKRMSMDKFEEILDVLDNKQNYRFSQKNMKFTGWGEPFMYGDSLFDMLSSAIKRGWKVKLTTNALLLTEENSRHLCEMGVSELDISLTGMTPEVFQKFQGNGFRYPDKILKQILLNIRRFIKIRESLGKGPKVYLSFLYCEESRKDLIPYLRVMKGGGVDGVIISELSNMKNYIPIIRTRCRRINRNELNIDYDGSVLLCCVDFERKIILGNVLIPKSVNDSLKRYQRINNSRKFDLLPLACQTCDYVSAKSYFNYLQRNGGFVLLLQRPHWQLCGLRDYFFYLFHQYKTYCNINK